MISVARVPWRGVAYAVLAALLFGVNGSMSKVVMESGITAEQLTWMRTTSTWVIAGVWLLATRPRALRVGWRDLGSYALIGVAGLALVQWFYSLAIAALPVGVALLFEYTAVILIALVARFVFKERVRGRVWVAIASVVVGLAVVAQVWGSTLDPLGVAAGLGAAVAFAWYFIGGEKLVATRHPLAVSFWAGLFASAFWTAFAPWWRLSPGHLTESISLTGALEQISAPQLALVLWIAVFGGFAPFMLIFAAMRHVSATTAGLAATSEVLFAFVIAWAWLGETLAPIQVVGAVIVFAGIVIGQTARPEATEEGAVAGPGDSPVAAALPADAVD